MRYFEKLTCSAILPSSQDIGRPKRTKGQALVVFFWLCGADTLAKHAYAKGYAKFPWAHTFGRRLPMPLLAFFFPRHLLCMSTFDIWDLILHATLSFCSLEDYCSWSLGFRITGGFGTISPSPVGKSARFLLVASLWFLPSPAQFPGHFILREVPGLLLYLRQMTSRLPAERLRAKWNTQPIEKFPCIQYIYIYKFPDSPPKKSRSRDLRTQPSYYTVFPTFPLTRHRWLSPAPVGKFHPMDRWHGVRFIAQQRRSSRIFKMWNNEITARNFWKKDDKFLGRFFWGSEWANEQLVKRMKLMGWQ